MVIIGMILMKYWTQNLNVSNTEIKKKKNGLAVNEQQCCARKSNFALQIEKRSYQIQDEIAKLFHSGFELIVFLLYSKNQTEK